MMRRSYRVGRLCRAALAWGVAMVAAGAAHAAETVAVLPIVVHSDDSSDYLREGLADMLASRLGQQPGIAVMRVEDPAKATTDGARAIEEARAAGAEWVLYGSFTHFGDGASIDLHCVRVTDTTRERGIFVQSGTLGDIIPRLDALAEKIGHHVLGESAAPAAVAAPGEAPPAASESELERRVQALEDRVFGPKTPKPAASAPKP